MLKLIGISYSAYSSMVTVSVYLLPMYPLFRKNYSIYTQYSRTFFSILNPLLLTSSVPHRLKINRYNIPSTPTMWHKGTIYKRYRIPLSPKNSGTRGDLNRDLSEDSRVPASFSFGTRYRVIADSRLWY